MSVGKRTGRLAAALAVAALACAAAAPGGGAGGGGGPEAGPDKPLRAFERAVLGPGHAAEHAAARRVERGAVRREAGGRSDAGAAGGGASQATTTVAPADEVGAWTKAPFTLPNYAIHAAMLPTGKVMFYGYEHRNSDSRGLAALWEPGLGTGPGAFTLVPPPEIDIDGDGDTETAPIFCSGQSFLADGELLVVGGILRDYDDTNTMPAGHDRVFTFDPWTESWTEQPSTEDGRYYPSQALLADGRTVILSGYTEQAPGGVDNPDLELFVPDDGDPDLLGEIERMPAGDRATAYYPHLFTMPDGNVLLAGVEAQDSAVLSSVDFTWAELPPLSRDRTGSAAVLRPEGPAGSWRVTELGGFDPDDDPGTGEVAATASTETIDLAAPDPEWQADEPLGLARARSNVVLLPDGSMVAVGGGSGTSAGEGVFAATEQHRQVELYDPGSGAWTPGPSQQEVRSYHSTALLLPDGRVFSSGDNYHPLKPDGRPYGTDTAEIYSPPYLFAGPRPRITGAPASIAYGKTIRIRTRDGVGSKAVLVAPSATTHAVDMGQRLVPLAFKGAIEGRGLRVAAPPAPEVAPPGWYMLFVLDDGVPSRAAWVHLG